MRSPWADGRGLRRAGEGQHAAQPLRHPFGPHPILCRPQPVQARQVPARHAHPHPTGRGARSGPARLRADHAVEPPRGDLRTAGRTFGSGGDASSSRSRGSRFSRQDPHKGGSEREGCVVLRGARDANALRLRIAAEADDAHRQPPGPVARHALLRPLRAHRVHPLPRFRGPLSEGLLPPLRRDGLERLRAHQGRRARGAAGQRHQRLEDHLHRHGHRHADRRAPPPRASLSRRATRSSWRTTATSSPTPP